MTISDDTIKKSVQRYHREYDRYLKLAARVAEICRSEVVEGNAIRAQVTSRAKSPKSLEGKLRRFAAAGKKTMADVDAVFDQIRDLSAVRIATYEQRHEDQIVSLVTGRFADANGEPPVPDRKDKNTQDPGNFYRATHVEVFLKPADIVGTYANVAEVPCEVQVCSMMAHVWNEVEHDLGYKPAAGVLSQQERTFLATLGHSVRMGDNTIQSLFAETERRQREQGGTFTDVYDFVARLRGWFPGAADFGRHAGPLFEALVPIRLASPDSIQKAIALPEPLTAAAEQAVHDLSGRLEPKARFQLDSASSDLLLVLLLPKAAAFLARTEPTTEGAARVRWLGLLLRVEQLVKTPGKRQGDLFAPVEERLRAALDRFVSEEASATNTRRRLFADDAAHGVALLSVAEKRFDVVLMNPPFGAGSTRAKRDFERAYPRTKNDVFAAFVERGIELLSSRGRIGAITSRTGFFLSSFQKWREEVLLQLAPPTVFADLGAGVLDSAMVETAAYCLESRR